MPSTTPGLARLKVSPAILVVCIFVSACTSGSDSPGETITSAPQTTTAAATTAVATTGVTSTEPVSTTEPVTTSTTEAVQTTLQNVVNPEPVNDALPVSAPDVAFIWDGLGGVIGPNGTDDWSTSAEPDKPFLGPWLHVTTAPDGSLWRSRLVAQTQDCAQLQLDISRLTSPNALDFAVSVPYTGQPNCAQDVLWPAGYSESFLITEGGLVLLHLDQEPRTGCLAPDCVPEVVASIEFRPIDALAAEGLRFEAVRTPMDADGRDPELARRVLNDFARIGAASTDQGTFVLDRAGRLVTLGSSDGSDVEPGAIPAHTGEGYFFTTSLGGPGSAVNFVDPSGSEITLFETDEFFVELLADSPDFLVLNLVLFEDAALAYYQKSTGVLYDTGLGGLPGVRNVYVRGTTP